MAFLSVIFGYLVRLPGLLFLLLLDFIKWIKNKGWLVFHGWGLHLYVGLFGAGKTMTMVRDAYGICSRYPGVTLYSNFRVMNFPKHTKIVYFSDMASLMEAPPNTLVLISEIGSLLNSRDFAHGERSLSKQVFMHLTQCRKRNMQILADTQRWNFLDKQLRDITATVRVTRSHLGHPWTRICTVRTYDAQEYDKAVNNPLVPLRELSARVYLQTDACRKRYNTDELIDHLKTVEYVDDEEILRNRGDLPDVVPADMDKKTRSRWRRNSKRAG